jgi:hypothetical protein
VLEALVPAVIHVDAAIPDEVALTAFGIECSIHEAKLNLVIASRVLAYGDSKARRAIYQGMTIVMKAVATEVVSDDGVAPALLPVLAPTGLSQGTTAMKRSGISAHTLTRAWALRPPMVNACFPLEVMTKFLPAPAWPYLAAFISAGPSDATRRLTEAMKQESQRLTARTVRTHVSSAWLLMRLLKEYQEEIAAENDGRARRGQVELSLPEQLGAWTWYPPKVTELTLLKMGARTDKRETSAVPLQVVRDAFKRQAAEAHWGRWAPHEWPASARWRPMKRLATLALLGGISPRVDHLRMLDVDDFAWHRFEDGSEAWGLRMRGAVMKLRNVNDIYWIKLPDELAAILQAWILCSGRQLGQPNSPLLIPNKVAPSEPGKRYTDTAMCGFITGCVNGSGGSRALVADGPVAQHGYQAHRYRSFVVQNVDAVMHLWTLQNPTHKLAAVAPKTFSELLVDHDDDDMGYRDHSFSVRREQIVALALAEHWRSIWGEGALRKGLDVAAIRNARVRFELITAEIRAIDHEVDALEVLKSDYKRRKDDLLRRAAQLEGDQRDDARFRLDIWRDKIDDLNDQISTHLRQQAKRKDALLEAVSELEAAKAKQVSIPDDVTEDVYAVLLAEALGEDLPAGDQESGPLADELTTRDVAELLGVHSQSVWRWRTGRRPMPHPRPFDPAAWIAYDEKDYRLPVDALNLAAVPAAAPHQALDMIRRRRATLGFSKRALRLELAA